MWEANEKEKARQMQTSVPLEFGGPANSANALSLLRGTHGSPLLEALPTKNGAPLRWPEGNRSFLAALRTVGSGLGTHLAPASAPFCALCLTAFTSFGFVFKSFVGEEHLFTGRENELRTTFGTLQDLIVIFHEPLSP
jgi:hypothetical protein